MSAADFSPWDGASYRPSRWPPQPPTRIVINHRRHFWLTVFTGGTWAVLVWWWLSMWVASRNRRQLISDALEVRQHNRVEELRDCRNQTRVAIERIPGRGKPPDASWGRRSHPPAAPTPATAARTPGLPAVAGPHTAGGDGSYLPFPPVSHPYRTVKEVRDGPE